MRYYINLMNMNSPVLIATSPWKTAVAPWTTHIQDPDKATPIVSDTRATVLAFLPHQDAQNNATDVINPTALSVIKNDPTMKPWSMGYTTLVASQIEVAKKLLRTPDHAHISEHIEIYITSMTHNDAQFALRALCDLHDVITVFAKKTPSQKIESNTPTTKQIEAWFQKSPYIEAQTTCLRLLDGSKDVVALIQWSRSLLSTALSNRDQLSQDASQSLSALESTIATLTASVSCKKIYQQSFGNLDPNMLYVLYKWDLLDPQLSPMMVSQCMPARNTSTISKELEQLLYINLIFSTKSHQNIR